MVPLSKPFKTALEDVLIPLKFPKNHILLEVPRIAEFCYFIIDGFAVSYSYTDGKKSTSEFWKSGQIMVSCNSFFEQVPAMESIQLLTDSTLVCVSYPNVQKLFNEYPEATGIYRAIMNRYYQKIRNRIYDLQALNASQRFRKLYESYPNIEQITLQESIASYLAITPQSLSRMKRKEAKAAEGKSKSEHRP